MENFCLFSAVFSLLGLISFHIYMRGVFVKIIVGVCIMCFIEEI